MTRLANHETWVSQMITNQPVRVDPEETSLGHDIHGAAPPGLEQGPGARSRRQLVRHQMRLRRRERLSAIGEMASTLVHEIRNPLAVIGGFARELLAEDDSGVEQNVPLNIIVSEVSRLETLIENVLGFARTERPRLRVCDINVFLRESCHRLEAVCRQSAIAVRLDLADGLPGVLLDQSQFRQVLDNLCANAREAMPHGGTITVTTCRVDGEVEVRISDTGPGVPAALWSRVFEPFYSTSSTGTGLGLAVAARIMAGHGGVIRLDGRARRGATFCLRFPVPKPTREA